MKRFLSLLTVFVLAFALAVPVGAVSQGNALYFDTELPNIETVWTDKENFPYAFILRNDSGYFLYLSDSLTENYYHEKEFNGSHVIAKFVGYRNYKLTDGTWTLRNANSTSTSSFQLNEYCWANFDIYSDETMTAVYLPTQVPVLPSCDGSACPATDVNIDGICDDCGMALMSLSRSPVAPDVTGNNKNYVMFYSGSVYQYTAYTSDSSYSIRGEEYGARYRTYLEPAVTATRFQSYDGINWDQTYNGTTANDYPGEIGYELISSTFDWYTEEGDRFFPVPLWEEVEKVTQGEMSNLTGETVGTLRVLVPFGVGLMALLVVLSLFGKRSLIFLR